MQEGSLEGPGGTRPVTLGPGPDGPEVQDLALADWRRADVELGQDRSSGGQTVGRGGVQAEVRQEQAGQDQLRIGGHGRLGVGDGVSAETHEGVDGPVEVGHAGRGGRVERHTPPVAE